MGGHGTRFLACRLDAQAAVVCGMDAEWPPEQQGHSRASLLQLALWSPERGLKVVLLVRQAARERLLVVGRIRCCWRCVAMATTAADLCLALKAEHGLVCAAPAGSPGAARRRCACVAAADPPQPPDAQGAHRLCPLTTAHTHRAPAASAHNPQACLLVRELSNPSSFSSTLAFAYLKVGYCMVMDLRAVAAALGGEGGGVVAVVEPALDVGTLHRFLLKHRVPGARKVSGWTGGFVQ